MGYGQQASKFPNFSFLNSLSPLAHSLLSYKKQLFE
jgi:hypothetical protein